MAKEISERVQTFGRKKTSVAVAMVKKVPFREVKGEDGAATGQWEQVRQHVIRVNGRPVSTIEPEALRIKVYEPLLILPKDKYGFLDFKIRVKGGGYTSQLYAVRQAIARGVLAYYQRYIDEQTKTELRQMLLAYDRTLVVSDPRRVEPKKFGGRGARARFQKSYR